MNIPGHSRGPVRSSVGQQQREAGKQQQGKRRCEEDWEWQFDSPFGGGGICEEDEEVQMGFEMMPAPGRKKRPYSVIASVLRDPSAPTQEDARNGQGEVQRQHPQGADVLKVPVPRFYDLEVGERILYTTTTLDEEKWEPVEAAPREATVLAVIGREGGTNSHVDTSRVSYRISAAGDGAAAGDTAVIDWAEMTQCWVLRSSPRPYLQSRSPGGGCEREERTSRCPEVSNLLDAISAKRSQL